MSQLHDGLVAAELVDIGGPTPRLFTYVLMISAGTATIKGYFVDFSGAQIGVSVTGTVTTTPQALGAILAFPSGTTEQGEDVGFEEAAGFVGRLSSDIIAGRGGRKDNTIMAGLSADMLAHPDRYSPITATDNFFLGRVG